MASEVVYESSLPWDPARPTTTLITCVDGRWFHHFQEFARVHLNAGTDSLAVPGGIDPRTLFDRVPKDFNFFRRRLEALVVAHGTQRIVAIAHQDCAWYRALQVGPVKFDLRDRQLADLRRSAVRLREMFPGIAVETYFARRSEADASKVVFEVIR
jgi:Putative carbonic anhydrase